LTDQLLVPGAIAEPGMTLRVNIGLGEQDRVLQIESFIERECDQSELDTLVEKMVRAGNRAKAKTMLPMYRRQLRFQEGKLNENRGRVAAVEAKLTELDRLRKEKALELRKGHDELLRRDQDAWANNPGKRGEYKPAAAVVSKLTRSMTEIKSLEADQSKDEAEAAQQLSILENEIKEGQRVLGEVNDMIRECEMLARHEDISGTE
jgi:hypothetical protein